MCQSPATPAGIGMRILKDQKMAFGSSNDLSRQSVKKLVTDLIAKVPSVDRSTPGHRA